MSKNDVKNRLALLFKKLWASFVLQKKKSILECDFGENGFLKKFRHKKRFYTQKSQKNSMLKNGVKSCIAQLFKELCRFFGFEKKIHP